MIDFLDYMNGIINHPEGYIASLQKDVDHYVNSGKWVEDMDKLEYEMNEVAKKAAKKAKVEDAKKLILFIKRWVVLKIKPYKNSQTITVICLAMVKLSN